jgi:proton-dependent oligopeptide transporter, POT family
LIAFSEIFASITSLEYAFTKAPKNMRSLVMSVCLFTNAISSAIGEAFVRKSAVATLPGALTDDTIPTALATDPLLVWNYASMGVLSFIAGLLFWFTFQDLDAKEDELNEIPAGELKALNVL